MMRLGDATAGLLDSIGLTKDRASRLLGRDCGCHARQQAMNVFGDRVAARFLFGLRPLRKILARIRYGREAARLGLFLSMQRVAFKELFRRYP